MQRSSVVEDPEQFLHDKWSRLFFPRTVMNETNYFVVLEYSTDVPSNGSCDQQVLLTRHSKMTGFVESRIKHFLAILQFQLGGLGYEDGLS